MYGKQYNNILKWIFENSGPIIRYKIVSEFNFPNNYDVDKLYKEALHSEEIQKWLKLLEDKNPLHCAKDNAFENIVSKLSLYGFNSNKPLLKDKIITYFKNNKNLLNDDYTILLSSLLCINFFNEQVKGISESRVDLLFNSINIIKHNIIRDQNEMREIPKKWKNKAVYKSDYFSKVPGIYDLYALSFLKNLNQRLNTKIERIVKYILHNDFQKLPSTIYVYNQYKNKKYCHSCISPKLPYYNIVNTHGNSIIDNYSKKHLILFLYIMTQFTSTFESKWYKEVMQHLETFKNEYDLYTFPKEYLQEKKDSYFLYSGAYMGLGENRKNRNWITIESTYWMMRFKKQEKLLSKKNNCD